MPETGGGVEAPPSLPAADLGAGPGFHDAGQFRDVVAAPALAGSEAPEARGLLDAPHRHVEAARLLQAERDILVEHGNGRAEAEGTAQHRRHDIAAGEAAAG